MQSGGCCRMLGRECGGRNGAVGIALTTRHEILVFNSGSLEFSYRAGRWQYWSHAHLVTVSKDLARRRRLPPKHAARVVREVYKAALDAAFKRHGALFVVLSSHTQLHGLVRRDDRIDSRTRPAVDAAIDSALPSKQLRQIPRAVLVELASIDGATVFTGTGELKAYGAILVPKRTRGLKGHEGARTKAAIGASHYGLAIKVSADGDIAVFSKGQEILTV
jgi:DNA integrity scanning protein DisA with diadenylate cyclase activity